jgi:multidrug efflux pump subunit AcrA (membrane-fusion protein)
MGEVATVLLRLERHESVLWISPAALRTFQNRDFVIVQDGEVQRRVDIRLGLQSPDRVEILEGLSEGQVVLGP